MNRSKGLKAPRTSGKRKESRSLTIGGSVSNSNIVVGNNNNIYVTQTNQKAKINRLPAPVFLGRPAADVNLLDRDKERDAVQTALTEKSPVEIYSAEGFGKTTLAAHLSAKLQLADGTLFFSVRAKSLDEIYFEIFKAFFESDQDYKPSQVEYLRLFADLHALIVLDDVNLARDEVQNLLAVLPGCVFILLSNERHLWDKGDVIHLSGLPSEVAVEFFVKRLGRPLSDAEKPQVEKICAALQNNPLQIIQSAVAVREDGKSIDALARELQTPTPEKNLYDQILSALPDSKKQALALMAVMGNAPLPDEHMAKILNTPNFPQMVGDLLGHGLALAHSPRYSLAGGLRDYLISEWDLSEWKNAALQYFVNWTSQPLSQSQILDAGEAMFAVLGYAAADGHWQELLSIGKSIESAFLFSGQWGAWMRLLNLLLQACRALGDRFNEAWVLHQLGSRALCLQDLTQAKDLLTQALDIRRAIGDKVGIDATQHNLGQLAGGPPPNKPPRPNGGAAPRSGWLLPTLVTTGLVGILLIGWLWNLSGNPFVPTKTPAPPRVVVTQTFTVTSPATPTFTPLPAPMPIIDINVSPDLAAQSIMLYQGANVKENYFQVPIVINVTNIGATNLADGFLINMSYMSGGINYPAGIMAYNDSSYVYQPFVKMAGINVGNSLQLRGLIKIPEDYLGSDVTLVADIDGCQKEIHCKHATSLLHLPNIIYDFVANIDQANWVGYDPQTQNSLTLKPSPDSLNDPNGSVGLIPNLLLEDGAHPENVLRTHPRWVSGGKIMGIYDLSKFQPQAGDQIVVRVGFINGAQTQDGVVFSVSCASGFNPLITDKLPAFSYSPPVLISIPDTNDGKLKDGIAKLPDGCANFVLQVDAVNTPDSDWAVWVSAFIERP